jgi:hypothetical protein
MIQQPLRSTVSAELDRCGESDLTYEPGTAANPSCRYRADAEPIDCVPMPGKAEDPAVRFQSDAVITHAVPFRRTRPRQPGRLSPVSEPH